MMCDFIPANEGGMWTLAVSYCVISSGIVTALAFPCCACKFINMLAYRICGMLFVAASIVSNTVLLIAFADALPSWLDYCSWGVETLFVSSTFVSGSIVCITKDCTCASVSSIDIVACDALVQTNASVETCAVQDYCCLNGIYVDSCLQFGPGKCTKSCTSTYKSTATAAGALQNEFLIKALGANVALTESVSDSNEADYRAFLVEFPYTGRTTDLYVHANGSFQYTGPETLDLGNKDTHYSSLRSTMVSFAISAAFFFVTVAVNGSILLAYAVRENKCKCKKCHCRCESS